MKADDYERRAAIAELLAQPDPPGLRRASRLRLQGKDDRYQLLPILSAAFVQARLLDINERRDGVRAANLLSTERRPL